MSVLTDLLNELNDQRFTRSMSERKKIVFEFSLPFLEKTTTTTTTTGSAVSIRFCRLYLVFCLLTALQSLDPQDGTANGDAELQDRQNNHRGNGASQKHLVGHKNLC